MLARLRSFLLEQYVPQLDETSATALARRLEDSSDRLRAGGVQIRWIHAVALPDEESLLCFIEAERIEDVRLASRQAGVEGAHVQPIIALDAGDNEPSGTSTPTSA
jgi:hypothetical protein